MSSLAARVGAATGARQIRSGRVGGALGKYAFLIFFAFLCVYPLVMMVSAALRDPDDPGEPFALFRSVRPQNIVDAWTLGEFGSYFFNTVVIAVPVVIGVVVLSILAGYALARFQFPARTAIFYLFVLGIVMPFFAMMIPLYDTMRTTCLPAEVFGPERCLLDTHLAVILPSIAGANGAGLPLGVFLMRAFFSDMPKELGEAAKVDGAGEWAVFRHVMLPLAGPGAAALGVFAFLQAWNTFLLPLIYMPNVRTLATGLLFFQGAHVTTIHLVAAGALFMILPVVIFYVLFQRQFIQGLTVGAVK